MIFKIIYMIELHIPVYLYLEKSIYEAYSGTFTSVCIGFLEACLLTVDDGYSICRNSRKDELLILGDRTHEHERSRALLVWLIEDKQDSVVIFIGSCRYLTRRRLGELLFAVDDAEVLQQEE